MVSYSKQGPERKFGVQSPAGETGPSLPFCEKYKREREKGVLWTPVRDSDLALLSLTFH